MSQKANLAAAKRNRNDEFYTQLTNIENEVYHYKKHFRNKVIYCNCDDPRVSKFFHYFAHNFEHLGLKKLITSCYKSKNIDMFSNHDSEQAVYLDYNGAKEGNKVPERDDIEVQELAGDGDFRNEESIEILKTVDIVVTNPPFSLFREYVAQLIEYDKKFVIIGNKNAVTYKEIFKLIKANKLWVGNTPMGVDMLFDVTKDFAEELVATKKEGSRYKIIDGVVKGRASAVWFTNLDFPKRHENLILYRKYNPEDYPKYDNYDAIEVSKTKDIPIDYDGAMGVPITFLDKYNPDQFDIIALGIVGSIDFSSNKKMEILDKNSMPTGKFTWNAKGTLYRHYNPNTDKKPAFKDVETGQLYSSIYARIIIRKR